MSRENDPVDDEPHPDLTVDPADPSITEPATLLTPVWVTKANMESTVVKDGFDTAAQICAIAGASACSAAGIH